MMCKVGSTNTPISQGFTGLPNEHETVFQKLISKICNFDYSIFP